MNDRDIHGYDALDRANTFGETITTENAPGSVAALKFTTVAEVVHNLRTERGNQVPTRNTSKEVLVHNVQLDLQAINRTAIAIAIDEPGFADTFHAAASANEGAVVYTARAYLKQLAKEPGDLPATVTAKAALVAKFVAHDLDANFVSHLQTDVDAIATENKRLEKLREGDVGDTAKIGPELKRGLDALKVLNAIMHNRYANQPAKLAAWLTASHIERDPKRDPKKPNPPTPPAPPA